MSDRVAIYAGTRNIYHDMVVSAKSLLFHHGADRIVFLIEDDTFPEPLPDCITTMNVSNQQFFLPSGPNFKCNWTYMVMMRIAISKLFPNLDRILALDHDTIIHAPIDYLWNIDLADYYYALVEEKQIRIRRHPYFNFGVAVHNLAQIRKDKIDDTIIQSLNTTRFDFCEQDAVNSACYGHILALPPEYNAMPFNIPPIPEESIIICHHAARRKPLNQFTDYIRYDRLPWNQILDSQKGVSMLPPHAKRYDIINQFIRNRNYRTFLEIGTDTGENYKRIIAPVRISVDPSPSSSATYRMTSDEFFDLTSSTGTPENLFSFDVIFIDGLHTCQQAYSDIFNSLSVLSTNGVIILHDCLPTSEIMQRHADSYPGGEWTGDVWKAFVKYRSESMFLTYTIDRDYGCGIIDRSVHIEKPALSLPSGTTMESLTYEDFSSNRDNWLNVKDVILNE